MITIIIPLLLFTAVPPVVSFLKALHLINSHYQLPSLLRLCLRIAFFPLTISLLNVCLSHRPSLPIFETILECQLLYVFFSLVTLSVGGAQSVEAEMEMEMEMRSIRKNPCGGGDGGNVAKCSFGSLRLMCLQACFVRPSVAILKACHPIGETSEVTTRIVKGMEIGAEVAGVVSLLVSIGAVVILINKVQDLLEGWNVWLKLIIIKVVVIMMTIQNIVFTNEMDEEDDLVEGKNDKEQRLKVLIIAEMAVASVLFSAVFNPAKIMNNTSSCSNPVWSPVGKMPEYDCAPEYDGVKDDQCNLGENNDSGYPKKLSRIHFFFDFCNVLIVLEGKQALPPPLIFRCCCHSKSENDRVIEEQLRSDTMNSISTSKTRNDTNNLNAATFNIKKGVISSTFSPLETAEAKFRSPIMSPSLKEGGGVTISSTSKKKTRRKLKTPQYNYDVHAPTTLTPKTLLSARILNQTQSTPSSVKSYGSCASDGLFADV